MKFETRVMDIIQRTYNVKSFRFLRPVSFDYKPGQYVFITIKSGQEQMKKPFSISSSPTEEEFIEFTKKLTDHPFSIALATLKAGDWAAVDGPYGNFTFTGEFGKVAMLSGGVGITPLRSICKYCTDTRSKAKVTLLYGNRTEKDVVFQKEFEEMQKFNKNLKVVFTVDEASEQWAGRTGRIDAEMIRKEIPDYLKTVFYTCGPPAMVEAIEKLLRAIRISEERIKTESFQGY